MGCQAFLPIFKPVFDQVLDEPVFFRVLFNSGGEFGVEHDGDRSSFQVSGYFFAAWFHFMVLGISAI